MSYVCKRAAMDEGRRVLYGLHEVRLQRLAQEHGHGAVGTDVAAVHGRAVATVADDDIAEPSL